MLKLKSLQLQLENLKVVFNEAMSNPNISVQELRNMREQIVELQQLIEERKKFLLGQNSDN
jgi:hypothetical protein